MFTRKTTLFYTVLIVVASLAVGMVASVIASVPFDCEVDRSYVKPTICPGAVLKSKSCFS